MADLEKLSGAILVPDLDGALRLNEAKTQSEKLDRLIRILEAQI